MESTTENVLADKPSAEVFVDMTIFDEETKDLVLPAEDSAQVAQKIFAIRAIENKISIYKTQLVEAERFYEGRIQKCLKQIEFFRGLVEQFMARHDLSKLQTHAGTASKVTRQKKVWPPTSELLLWIRTLPEPERFLRKTEEVNMVALGEYIAETKETPPGYLINEETKLQIRKVNE